MNNLDKLQPGEKEMLYKIPALVAVLVAGADNEIDQTEIKQATRVIDYRTFSSDPDLNEYYVNVDERFDAFFNQLLETCGGNPRAYQDSIIREIEKVNAILPKLNPQYAEKLVKSWKTYARRVAEASGGFLGFGSVDEDERKFIDLPMIKLPAS